MKTLACIAQGIIGFALGVTICWLAEIVWEGLRLRRVKRNRDKMLERGKVVTGMILDRITQIEKEHHCKPERLAVTYREFKDLKEWIDAINYCPFEGRDMGWYTIDKIANSVKFNGVTICAK